MGEFTQNLLKLTEFPFSYSLIGLLTLIFGHGLDPEQLSFAKFGPLLILMGFIATTLSICDPVGAFQRQILLGKQDPMGVQYGSNKLLSASFFGKTISPAIFPPVYLFAIAYSPERLRNDKTIRIRWDKLEQIFIQSREITLRYIAAIDQSGKLDQSDSFKRNIEESVRQKKEYESELDKIGGYNIADIYNLLVGLKHQAVKTKWITAEIDRITALVYFIITISVFIWAILTVSDFLPKFAESFANSELTKVAILSFSFVALIAVIYMFILRIRGLQAKTLTVLKYLTALGTIKTAKEKFKTPLEDVERYLNDTHWILAEYRVNRIQEDYSELFLDEVRKT